MKKKAKKKAAPKPEPCSTEALENPGYEHGAASFDLFGGESRKVAKKASEVSRPRVRVHGHTVTFAKHSPFKGRVEMANPVARVVRRPVKIELSAKEAPKGAPSKALQAKILQMAATTGKDWDHVEVTGPNGAHLFDLVP